MCFFKANNFLIHYEEYSCIFFRILLQIAIMEIRKPENCNSNWNVFTWYSFCIYGFSNNICTTSEEDSPFQPLSAIKKLFPFSFNAAPICISTLPSRQNARHFFCNLGSKYQVIKPHDRDSTLLFNKSNQNDYFIQVGMSYGRKAEPGAVLCNTVLISWIAIIKGGRNINSLIILMLCIIYHLSRFCVLWPFCLFTLAAWWEWIWAKRGVVLKIQWAKGPMSSSCVFRGKVTLGLFCSFPTDWLPICGKIVNAVFLEHILWFNFIQKETNFYSKMTPCCKPERIKEGQPGDSVSWFKLMCCGRHTSVVRLRQL